MVGNRRIATVSDLTPLVRSAVVIECGSDRNCLSRQQGDVRAARSPRVGVRTPGRSAVAIGTGSALWTAAAAILVGNLSMLLIPAVWRIRERSA